MSNPHNMQTPTPRDHNVASMSEIMPFRSSRIKLWKSPLFLLALLAALAVPLLFNLMGKALQAEDSRTLINAFLLINIVSVFFVLMTILAGFYLYSKPGRSIWIYMIPFSFISLLLTTRIGDPYFFIFRHILPGNFDPAVDRTFVSAFTKMFFGAGLMEELMKATPILIGLGLTVLARTNPLANNPLYKIMYLRGPIDGVLMGVFAGAGFILLETALEYVPRTASQVMQGSGNAWAGVAAGLMLLLPRVFGGLVGHMAYAGLFGYFIGLAAIRPKQMWQLLGIGWLSAATIHALWNSVDTISQALYYVVAGVCAVAVVGALLKARQLDAAAGHSGSLETSGSIVVDRPVQTSPPARYPTAPQAAPQYAPAPATPQAAPMAQTSVGQALVLDIDGFIIPLREASRIDLAAEPALAGRGAGIVGDIVAHPRRPGVLGLRNAGATPWTARLRDGGVQTIEPNQNVRLAPGVVIAFAAGLNGAIRSVG